MASRDNHRVQEAAHDVRRGASRFAFSAGKAAESVGQQVKAGTSVAAANAPQIVEMLRSSVDDIAEWVPEAASAARVGVMATSDSMRRIPDPTLRTVAAVSVGMGIGLYLAGAPRPVTIVAFTPAMMVGLFMAFDEPLRKRARS
jgi:hypothetical protein